MHARPLRLDLERRDLMELGFERLGVLSRPLAIQP